MKNIYLAAALCASTFTLVGCGQKAEQPKAEPVQAPNTDAADAAYDGYMQEIKGLSQVGIETTNGKYPVAKVNTLKFNSAVAELEQRIKSDSAIEGTEASGKRADLLTLLRNEAGANAAIFRDPTLNKAVIQKLRDDVMMTGSDIVLKDDEFLNAIGALKGEAGLKTLADAQSTEEFNARLNELLK